MNHVLRNSIKKDYEPYFDEYGMVQNKITNGKSLGGAVSGNGNLYSAHYIMALVDNHVLTQADKNHFKQVYENNERKKGLLMRSPRKDFGINSHDDLLGAIFASRYIDDKNLAKRIYEHGYNETANRVSENIEENKHPKLTKYIYLVLKTVTLNKVKWVYNCINPKAFHLSGWLGRRPEIVATIQGGAGKKIPPLTWIYWAINMLLILFKDPKTSTHNTYILRYYQARILEGYGPITDFVIWFFRKKFRKDWGNMGNLIGAYFNDNNNPNAKYLRNSD